MPLRLYLDTSVLGAEFDEESPERVALTRSLFEWIERGGHVVCYSTVTAAEVARAPERIRRHITDWLHRWEIDLVEESAAPAHHAHVRAAVRGESGSQPFARRCRPTRRTGGRSEGVPRSGLEVSEFLDRGYPLEGEEKGGQE